MHDDQMMAWVMKDATQIIRELLGVYGIPVEDIQTTPFQGQMIDSTLIVLPDHQLALPAPVHNSTTERCRIMDNDEPL